MVVVKTLHGVVLGHVLQAEDGFQARALHNQIERAKSINASEVQVTYADYEKVSSGQRATIALYDIYGNPVSTGYLDNLGMGTLSTKGKSGIYIVKVIMNNQVIFNQRIQVK